MFIYSLGVCLKLDNQERALWKLFAWWQTHNTSSHIANLHFSPKGNVRERMNVQLGLEQVHLCKYNKYKWCANLNMKVSYQISPRWQVNVDLEQHTGHTETISISIHISQTVLGSISIMSFYFFFFFPEKWINTKKPRILFSKLKQEHRFSTFCGVGGGLDLCQLWTLPVVP